MTIDGDDRREIPHFELPDGLGTAELLEPNNPNRFLIDVYSKLADLADGEGRKEEAYEYMKKAMGMQRAVSESLIH